MIPCAAAPIAPGINWPTPPRSDWARTVKNTPWYSPSHVLWIETPLILPLVDLLRTFVDLLDAVGALDFRSQRGELVLKFQQLVSPIFVSGSMQRLFIVRRTGAPS